MTQKQNIGLLNNLDYEKQTGKFEELKNHFAKQTIAIFMAEHLLQNSYDLTAIQTHEVKREGECAKFSANIIFDEMLQTGIPDDFLSCHLQANLIKNS